MRRTSLILTSALILGLPSAATGVAEAWSADEIARIRLKPRIAQRNGGVTASFFVGTTPERAYAILADHAQLPEFMPNLDACHVRRRGPNWAEVEMKNAKGTMVLRRVYDPPRSIRWTLVEGSMLKRVEGSWRLDGVEGGTILTYDSEVQTTVPVPAFIIQFVQQDSLGALISNVRQRIDTNGAWTKPGFKKGS